MPDETLLAGLGAGDADLARRVRAPFPADRVRCRADRRRRPGRSPRTSPSRPSSRRGGTRQVYDSRRGSVRAWLTTITHNLADRRRPRAHLGAPWTPTTCPLLLTAVTDTPERVAVANDSAAGLRRGPRPAAGAAGPGGGDGGHLRHDRTPDRRCRGRSPGHGEDPDQGRHAETAAALPPGGGRR